ncbi:hypothetical protein CBR_g2783 [Chara braunii]|uniref:FAD-binding domain-containing protein n=1 Tax=Chara braunii TaxID=69332 RepID=A0A388KDU3_CHABU|nr:hypothetical protein CBR_g2783 [Chara braunii]|eukprot:GBG68232.1 hypothetical protein CBR_g2783 [Chara braunii]
MAAVCASGSATLRAAATSTIAAHHSGPSQAAAVTRSHSEAGCSTSSKIGRLPLHTLVIDHPPVTGITREGKRGTCAHSQQLVRTQGAGVYTCQHEVKGWSAAGLTARMRASSLFRRALRAPASTSSDCASARRGRGRSARVCSCSPRAEASATTAEAVRQSSAQVADTAPSSSNRAETAEAHSRTAAQAGASLRTVVRSLDPSTGEEVWRPLRVLVVGAGIGGLVFALAAKKKGIDVQVFERDVSAIRGEGQYRGPIQIQSNALAALEAIDQEVAERVMHEGVVTGDRVNGLVDGLTGEWYIKFDTWHPAVRKGLPVTRVISRMTLQEIVSEAVGADIVRGNSYVVDYEDDGEKVVAILDDGRRIEGDLLVGADGIRSKVLLPTNRWSPPQVLAVSALTSTTSTDGYRVFLGSKQYFVSSDVGHGKMQWYAFHYQEAGQQDPPGPRKERLLQMFGNWCDEVVDVLLATPEEMILRRDIYDRIPIVNWSKGRVTLLGDSAHAMQPNMGQGGCMAIEDCILEEVKLYPLWKTVRLTPSPSPRSDEAAVL